MARTTYGNKLAAAAYELTMSFGVADINPATRTGWSVIVTGRARPLGDADDLELAGIMVGPLEAWAPGEKDFYIAIPATEISGRRISAPRAHHESSRGPDSGPSVPSPPSTT
ncbi:MAG: pyridoxamine 5'-phosphate oxidase family protein [Actinomycetota bacterium]|nr:pyridoxamine 5'-phosphate oxidase family protein [Actinomycetota bacterium]